MTDLFTVGSQESPSNTDPGSSTGLLANFRKKKDNKKLLAEFEGNFNVCARNRVQFERVWWMNLAFYFGRQYAQWYNAAGGMAARLYEPIAPSWRVRLISNKIKPIIRAELAKLTQEKPQPFVIPASSDNIDRIAAQAAESTFQHLMVETKFNKELRKAVFWAILTGSGFIKDYYNSEEWDSSGVQGKICVEKVTPFHLYVPDVAEEELDKQSYVIHATAMSLDDVQTRYGEVEGLMPDVNSQSGVLEQKYLSSLGIADSSRKNDKILVKEIWFKRSKKYPQGLFAVWANDKFLVEPQDSPYIYNEYPFTKIDHIPTGRFYGDSVIVDLIPLQKEYNRTRSQIIEAKNRMSKPQLIAPRGSVQVSKITSEPGLVIEYQPGFDPPSPLPLQQLPQYVIEEQDRIQADMDDISAQHEVSKGSVPPGVEAATAISYLQEQDDSKLSPTVSSIEEATEKIGRHLLSHVVQFWAIERKIKVFGPDGQIETMALTGSMIQGNVDLRVQAGSAAPRSRAAKQAFLMELGKMGWLPPDKVLRYLDMGEVDKLYEELQIDSRQAQRENIKMTAGEMLSVNSWDNHEIHIAEHNNYRKSEEFEQLDEQIKMLFEMHVTMHQQLVMQANGGMLMPGQQMPAGMLPNLGLQQQQQQLQQGQQGQQGRPGPNQNSQRQPPVG